MAQSDIVAAVTPVSAFRSDALHAIAKEAMKRNTGARALRTIIEEVMMNVMYEIPSLKDVKRCVITESTVVKREEPIILTLSDLRQAS